MEEGPKNDFLPSFTEALIGAGVQPSTIRSFLAYWGALPADTEKRPCPLCYARGQQGWLQATVREDGAAHFRCQRCRGRFRD